MLFRSNSPHYEYLKNKWVLRQKVTQNKFWDKHGSSLRQMALGSLGGLMLLSAPAPHLLPTQELIVSRDDVLKGYDQNVLLAEMLTKILPNDIRPLNPSEEEKILNILTNNFGFKVTAELEGIKLNRSYGLIGGEQHLYRYPGDNLYAHADSASDFAKYSDAGIAPNLGAWGYFATSKEAFTENEKLKERYYLAIQTFLAPGFAENVEKYRDFFKFRKMLVVNPKSGQAAVAVIGDAGPADWTGKHLGGSPEIMDILGLATGPRKGAVLYFLIDDPNNKVPLGPVKIKSQV